MCILILVRENRYCIDLILLSLLIYLFIMTKQIRTYSVSLYFLYLISVLQSCMIDLQFSKRYLGFLKSCLREAWRTGYILMKFAVFYKQCPVERPVDYGGHISMKSSGFYKKNPKRGLQMVGWIFKKCGVIFENLLGLQWPVCNVSARSNGWKFYDDVDNLGENT